METRYIDYIENQFNSIGTLNFSVNGLEISILSLIGALIVDVIISYITFKVDQKKNPNASMQTIIFKNLIKLLSYIPFRLNYFLFNIIYHKTHIHESEKYDIVHLNYNISNIPDLFTLLENDDIEPTQIKRFDELVNVGIISENKDSEAILYHLANAKNEIRHILKPYFNTKGINDVFNQAEDNTTSLFINSKNTNHQFHNGTNYGFLEFKKEKRKFEICITEQDYYSFKFRTLAYNIVKVERPDIFSPSNIYQYIRKFGITMIDIDNLKTASPFLGLVGLGVFIIIDQGNGDELLFVKRSSNLHVGGFWHYSIDETFDPNDRNSLYNNHKPDIQTCLIRALREELGQYYEDKKAEVISKNIKYFSTGIINTDNTDKNNKKDERLEVQVLCGLRLELNSKFSWKDFKYRYLRARDKEQEIERIKLVKTTRLEHFFRTENHFSPESIYLAKAIRIASRFHKI